MPSDSTLKAPKGMFRLRMNEKLSNEYLDYSSLEKAKKAFTMLTTAPDSKKYTITIRNDTGDIELSNST